MQRRRDRGRAPEGGGEIPVLGDVLEFMRAIWGISHGLQSTSKRMEARLGITAPQRLVVRIVGHLPGTTAGRLAEILHLHPSTLTGVLRRLEDRGVLARSRGKRDRRQARLRLTPKGRVINRRHAGTVEGIVRRVLSRLEPAKIETAAEVLRALESALSHDPTVS